MTNVRPEVLEGLHNTIHQLRAERDALRHDVERLERAAQVSLERDETARQALRAERDALKALLADIRAAGRITGDIAVRLIAALKE